MSRKIIDGKCFAEMLQGGAAMLSEHAQEINDLNVFPVPDGDTGTNMTKTLEGGLCEISEENNDSSVGALSDHFARGVLLGARGNSGVILSQIFAGINEELSKYDNVSAKELAKAFQSGIKKAYSAVQNPTEGTILTVFRESTEYAASKITDESSVEDFFKLHIEKARISLERTKEILPALKEADVVDSGAAGYLYIIMGMYAVLTGELQGTVYKSVTSSEENKVNINLFTRDSKLEFGYCTEFLLRLMSDRTDPDSFNIDEVLSVLDELGGESVVAYKNDDIVKVHVHTFNPGAILSRMQSFGEFLTVKIENMSLGHSGTVKPKIKTEKKYSVLTVANGEGLCSLFRELGADEIVAGGQTSNPSTEEFISAFERCDSENIFVLPNNKNVFLAAKQAAEIYDKAKIYIIPTKNLMQGYGALSVITPGITDMDVLAENIERAANGVVGSEITKAVRDVTINGKQIKAGDYIAITEGNIGAVEKTAEAAVMQTISEVDPDEYEIITLFVGKDVSDDARAALTERIEEEYPDFTLDVYIGGQDVYDYLIAIE
ncbi:MAG: DAK2 domain-containing protein [Ruminococcaceae bacterium]|nr:DAK2 domain-containing protein [Oscillospiraceae bacterium]